MNLQALIGAALTFAYLAQDDMRCVDAVQVSEAIIRIEHLMQGLFRSMTRAQQTGSKRRVTAALRADRAPP